MRVLAMVHQLDAGPGVFADAVRAQGVSLDAWLVPDGGRPPRALQDYGALIVLGGAMHTDQEDVHPWLRDEKALLAEMLEDGVPLLGVCLGAQLLAEAAGAPARRASEPELGWREVELDPATAHDPVLGPLPARFEAFQWHRYEFPLPPGGKALARSAVCLQAYRIGTAAWGIQFHAEVTARDAEAWIDDLASDPDAVRIGVDPGELRRRTRAAIAGWNELGRGLCERFLETATRA